MESIFLPTPTNDITMGVIGGSDGPTAIFTASTLPASPLMLLGLVAVISIVGIVLWKNFGHK